ncbi:MAG: TonB-dependent receptor [Candidatus Syntrophosphaera sp.]|nr:TonB-dependent receptor [Candidatus Syntrophosphaera sp.]
MDLRFAALALLLVLLALPAQSATVSGFVTREDSGEPMQYVNVLVSGTRIGGQTNKLGYYVLNLNQPGNYVLDFTLVSYLKKSVPITIGRLGEDVTVNVRLAKSSVELSKVVVTAHAEASLDGPAIRTSTIHRGREDIQSVVSPVEADVFRAVLTLPGVAPISDFSSGLYVRGGSPDQNLILLDDIDVYNPSHFGGIFSTFNTDAVENVELIKGGYPAKFGGRMSSVLDVTNRQGNRMHHQGIARLSLISSSATLEGPWKIGSQSGSYMASIRRTYVELLQQFYSELPDYYFYDGQAKLNWDLDARNKLSLSTYFGRDDLSFDLGSSLDLDWGNRTFSAQWVHIFNPRLFSQFIFAGSEFKSNFTQTSEQGELLFKRLNGIQDLSTKGILSWKPSNRHELETGYELKWNDTWLRMDTSYQYEENGLPDVEVSSLLSAAFIQDTWEINPLWTLQPGLRATWYRTLQARPGHIPAASYVNLEPRLSVRRNLDVGESVYANFGAYHQYLTLMSMEVSTPFDIWFPLDGSLEPGLCLHYILGYRRDLSKYFSWDAELYYKTYQNLLQYDSSNDFTWNNETGTLSDTFHVGKGFTYGADLMLRTDWKGLQGFLAYTLSQTKRDMEGVNIDPATGEAVPFFPLYDRTHSVSLVQTFNVTQNTGFQVLGADFKIGANFSYNSGQPGEIPERIYYDGESFQLIYSYKDRVRLPAYVRLDLSTKYEWITRWGSIEPYLEVINVFNRDNVSFRNYSLYPQSDGSLQLNARDGTQFPFLPFVGVNISW